MLTTWIVLALAATNASGAVIVDKETAYRANSAPAVTEIDARLRELAKRGAADALADEVRTVATDATLEPAGREWLLESGMQALRTLPSTPASRALATELASRMPRVFTQVEPEHGRHAVPLYDVAAVARYALRGWTRNEARAAAARSLSSGSQAVLASWLREDGRSATHDGIADAFAAASTDALRQQRPAIVEAIRSGRDVDALALMVARRLQDDELYSLVIGYAEPAIALAAVQSAPRDLDRRAALRVLAEAADREPVASAALLAVGKLAASEPAARDLLFERLVDPVSGESAAAALAHLDDPGISARLATRLQTTHDEPTLRRIALALKLNDSSAARDALTGLVESKHGSPELRKEVAAWLARGR